jgi:H+-transporting ATPase
VGIAVEGCTDAARSAADIVLLAPGLSTIIDGVKTSRAIFQRLRSYALYRITSTIHFLIFMFIITLVENWRMPAILLIMICVLVSHDIPRRIQAKEMNELTSLSIERCCYTCDFC